MKIKCVKEQFQVQTECLKKTGLFDHTMLGFGSLLGHVREGGVIGHDSDMDIIILADKVTVQQIDNYIKEIRTAGLYRYREAHAINPVTKKHWWTSIRMHPRGSGMKCCSWFMFEHLGYLWHHKGPGTAIKGIPTSYLFPGKTVEFLGSQIRIPRYAGAALDFWYPDWLTSRSDVTKSYSIIMRVDDWQNKSSWKINS